MSMTVTKAEDKEDISSSVALFFLPMICYERPHIFNLSLVNKLLDDLPAFLGDESEEEEGLELTKQCSLSSFLFEATRGSGIEGVVWGSLEGIDGKGLGICGLLFSS